MCLIKSWFPKYVKSWWNSIAKRQMIQLKKDKRFEQPFSQRCRIAKNKWKEQVSRISHQGNAEPSHRGYYLTTTRMNTTRKTHRQVFVKTWKHPEPQLGFKRGATTFGRVYSWVSVTPERWTRPTHVYANVHNSREARMAYAFPSEWCNCTLKYCSPIKGGGGAMMCAAPVGTSLQTTVSGARWESPHL